MQVPPRPRRRCAKVSEIPGIKRLWSETTGDPAIRVAFLDGPVDTAHPSLVHARIEHVSLSPSDRTPSDGLASGHGTNLASIVLGRHGSGVDGIAPRCHGIMVPIFRNGDSRSLLASQLDLARAIYYALEKGAHIINISGGQPEPSGSAQPLLADAVRQCQMNDTLIVAASGNDGDNTLHVPAAISSVLAVGATSFQGEILSLTNWPLAHNSHGVLAPGQDLLAAQAGGGFATATGTSFAAGVVTGVAALLMSLQVRQGLQPSPNRVRDAIVAAAQHTDPNRSPRLALGRPGRLKVLRARALLVGGARVVDHASRKTSKTPSYVARNPNSRGVRNAGRARAIQAAGDVGDHVEFDEAGSEMNEELVVDSSDELMDDHEFDEAGSSFNDELSSVSSEEPTRNGAGPPHLAKAGESRHQNAHVDCPNCNDVANPATNAQQQLVYCIGQPSCDLVTEARRRSLTQEMAPDKFADNVADLVDYVDSHPWESDAVEWTLNLDATPIYAIRPEGAFAREGYERLRQVAHDYLDGKIERVGIAGTIVGETQLITGQIVPVVRPDLRCFYSWTTSALLESVAGDVPAESASKKIREEYAERSSEVRNFLERVYEDIRNLGLLPQHRALNYAATNALNAANIFDAALREQMQLDEVGVERSAICPPGEDCWDVRLTFFNPARQLEQARKVYKLTVNVSESCPSMVGTVRSWYVR